MNHNLRRIDHVAGAMAVARKTALEHLYDPEQRPAVGECTPETPLVTIPVYPDGAARVLVRVIRWKK